jgi:hypothetical protein
MGLFFILYIHKFGLLRALVVHYILFIIYFNILSLHTDIINNIRLG